MRTAALVLALLSAPAFGTPIVTAEVSYTGTIISTGAPLSGLFVYQDSTGTLVLPGVYVQDELFNSVITDHDDFDGFLFSMQAAPLFSEVTLVSLTPDPPVNLWSFVPGTDKTLHLADFGEVDLFMVDANLNPVPARLDSLTFHIQVKEVPEPSSWLLLLPGLAGLWRRV